jgi:hypothetical protein
LNPYSSLFLYINAIHRPRVARKQVLILREVLLEGFV